MKLFDLSHPISNETPVFPGTPAPQISELAVIEKDGYREKMLSIQSHISTHMDAPAHIIQDGLFLDQMPIDSFYGRGLVVDARQEKLPTIGSGVLDAIDFEQPIDFLLFYSGWQQYWTTDAYFQSSPFLSPELAARLTEQKLKGVGIDSISLDPIESRELPAHNSVLGNNMVILENLANLDKVVNITFILSAFPLKIKQADGSPVRVVAIADES